MTRLFSDKFLSEMQEHVRVNLCLEFFSLPQEASSDYAIVELGYPLCALEPPIVVTGELGEKGYIESSINSLRVSIHFATLKDSIRNELLEPLLQRVHFHISKNLTIIRRRPISSYDISFLFHYNHLHTFTSYQLESQFTAVLLTLQERFNFLLDYPAHFQYTTANTIVTALVDLHSFLLKPS